VLGLDPQSEGRALRQLIGSQLQESALPDRIKVWEALDLFASFLPRGLDWRELMEQWGLVEKRNASFSSLSGGQRQRLFVALALVNNPKVVFLDEMTHFMDKAEHLCDRLAIVDQGRLVALDTPQGLITTYANQIRVVFTTDHADISWLEQIPQVRSVTRHGPRVEVEGSGPVLALVAALLVAHGITPSDLRMEQPTLEDVFLAVTGRRDRN
jgi:ABC-2 type transport system ATP-binding protein